MKPRSLRRSLTGLVLAAICGVGCARPARPAAVAKPAPEASAAPSAVAPNTERDRRAEPGVRAAAKPLVREASHSPKCGKLATAALGGSGPRKGARDRRAEPEAASPADLLSGRYRIGPLGHGRALPSPKDGPSLEEESRFVVEASHEGLAIVAKETFQLDPDRFAAEPEAKGPGTLDEEAPKFLRAAFPEEEALEIAPVEIGRGEGKLRAYAARPKAPNAPPGRDVALVLALLVAHPDGTLQTLSFHVRGELVRAATGTALVGCTRLAERVADTLEVGPRALERTAGPRSLAPDASGPELSVSVPADYVAVKGDAQLRLYKLRPISMYAGNIAIVVGPKRDEGAAGAEAAGAEAVPGKLLGRDVRWQKKVLPKGGGWLHASEALDAGGTRFADVVVKTRQAKMLDEMKAVAETLRTTTR